ncbi:uncharacterized protein TNCV_2177501 [Trichonephila clavipes]|uniref:Transposase n=1 Tax=Trichonephila clavipes TaxID=2585209 RepID=A0A8X7B8S9_TRICX|nr:uncharacterized protein TNCV_2177501 [Trichonephila clavipes]
MPRCRIKFHYEQLSEFERGHIIRVKEVGRENRRIARHMGQSDASIRRCWQEWVDSGIFQLLDGSGRHRATSDWEDSNKSRFQLYPDDHRRRVWRRSGQCADLAFTIARHTRPHQEL